MMSPPDIRPPTPPPTHTHLKASQLLAQLPVNKEDTFDYEVPEYKRPPLKSAPVISPTSCKRKIHSIMSPHPQMYEFDL